MQNITVFNFDSNEIRVINLSGEPWFVCKDVLQAIQSSTTVTAVEAMVIEDLGDEFVCNQPLPTNGGQQSFLCLSEAGLTFFISRSRTESGKRLNRWIHTEILPAIRKTGSYSIPTPEPSGETGLALALRMTEILQISIKEQQEQAQLIKQQQSQLNALLENQAIAESELKSLPISPDLAAPKTIRSKINEVVRSYVRRTNANYADVWDKLYKELYYRCHYDAKARAKHRNKKPLDCVESDGLIDALWAITSELL